MMVFIIALFLFLPVFIYADAQKDNDIATEDKTWILGQINKAGDTFKKMDNVVSKMDIKGAREAIKPFVDIGTDDEVVATKNEKYPALKASFNDQQDSLIDKRAALAIEPALEHRLVGTSPQPSVKRKLLALYDVQINMLFALDRVLKWGEGLPTAEAEPVTEKPVKKKAKTMPTKPSIKPEQPVSQTEETTITEPTEPESKPEEAQAEEESGFAQEATLDKPITLKEEPVEPEKLIEEPTPVKELAPEPSYAEAPAGRSGEPIAVEKPVEEPVTPETPQAPEQKGIVVQKGRILMK